MRCAWQAFLNLLPQWMRADVDKLAKTTLLELRMRLQMPPELVMLKQSMWLTRCITSDDLTFTVNIASRYSPWTADGIASGYITAPGGHRIGLCGQAIMKDGATVGIQPLRSLCIRISRDLPGISDGADDYNSSILIIGSPGSGKTTLLRDIIRQRSDFGCGSVAVIDERSEIFPCAERQNCFPPGRRTDILSGCRKSDGISMLLRTMGPTTIALDEITAEEDCHSLLHAGWCGVKLIATAHAGDLKDLCTRPIYKPIIQHHLFDYVIVIRKDKTWRKELLYQ